MGPGAEHKQFAANGRPIAGQLLGRMPLETIGCTLTFQKLTCIVDLVALIC